MKKVIYSIAQLAAALAVGYALLYTIWYGHDRQVRCEKAGGTIIRAKCYEGVKELDLRLPQDAE